MFLVELVMQGIRGFRELARLRFQSGFNLVVAGNEAGKTTAVDSMRRLLFPGNQAELLEALVSRHSPEASRAALVLCADDGAYYRIIQDFSKRAVNLSAYNTASKEFSLLHKDWDNAAPFMAGLTTGISEEDYTRIFFYQRERHAARPGVAVPSGAAPRAVLSKPAPSSGGKAEADRTRLAELRETLRKAEDAADAEYRCQSAKLALEELGKKLDSFDELEQKKAGIESTLDSLKGCDGMPENLSELIDDQERRQGKQLAEADECNGRIEGLKTQLAEMPARNLVTDKLFILGAAVGALSILAGVFVLTAELAYVFPIGLLLSLVLMAGAWYSNSRKNLQRKNVLKEVGDLENELAELEKQFQREGATITDCMRSAGASSPGELKEKAGNYRYSLSLRDDIEEQRQRIFGDLTLEIIQQQYQRRQLEVMELEKAARAVARHNVDTYSIRQDIERIDSEATGVSAELSWDFSAEAQDLPADFADSVAGGGRSGFRAELGIASRVGGIELETLVPAVEAAAQRNLAAVTGGKYVRIEAGQEGDPVVHAQDDSVVNYAELSHGTKSLIYFCLRTGLAEALAGKRRLPFILDDPLADFDPMRQKAACQVLRALGTKTQVILFTSNPALKAEGDAVAELK